MPGPFSPGRFQRRSVVGTSTISAVVLAVGVSAVGLAPQQPLLVDDTTRADSAVAPGSPQIGGPYVQWNGTWGISSNHLYNPAGVADTALVYDVGVQDQDVSVTHSMTNFAHSAGVIVRGTSASNFIAVSHDDTNVYVLLETGPLAHTVNSGPGFAFSSGVDYTLRATAIGNVISTYVNGTFVWSYTLAGADITRYTGTSAGVFANADSTSRYSALSVRAIGATTEVETALPSGVSVASAVGAVTLPVKPSGVSVTSAVGTPVELAVALPAGVAVTSATGTPVEIAVALPSGVSVASAVGSVTNPVVVAGVAVTSAVGTPVEVAVALPSGVAATSALGTPTKIVVALPAGVSASSAVGSVTSANLATPAGVAVASAVGTPVDLLVALPAGVGATASVGTVTPTTGGGGGGGETPLQLSQDVLAMVAAL